MVISLAIGIITARYLGPSNYGLINYANSYVAFFSAFCTLGIHRIIIKEFIDYPEDQGEAIGSALVVRFLSSMASIMVIIAVVSLVDKDEPLTIAVVFLCSIGAVFQIFDTFNYWFQYQYKAKVTAIATFVAYLVMSIYKVYLLVSGRDVRWFAFATSIDYMIVALILAIVYKKNDGMRLSFSFNKAKALLKVSYHYIFSTVMVAIYGYTDRFMLKQCINDTEVGYYGIAVAVCTMWPFILQAIIDSVYPTILRLKNENEDLYERKNRQLYAIVFYVSVFVSIFILIFAKAIIFILYGSDYLPAANVLKIVTWYTAFSYIGVARNAWIVSEGKQKYLKYVYLLAIVLNVILNMLFIPMIGALGAAVASLITEISTSLFFPLMFPALRPNAQLIFEAILLKNVSLFKETD